MPSARVLYIYIYIYMGPVTEADSWKTSFQLSKLLGKKDAAKCAFGLTAFAMQGLGFRDVQGQFQPAASKLARFVASGPPTLTKNGLTMYQYTEVTRRQSVEDTLGV